MAQVSTHRDGEVLVLTIDNPPVNAISMTVRIALTAAAKEADADPAVEAVAMIGAAKPLLPAPIYN